MDPGAAEPVTITNIKGMENMQNWFQYLCANPILGIAVVVILLLFVVMVLRKLIKWAVISFVILAVVVGLTYNESQKSEVVRELEKQAEKLKDGAQKLLEKGKDEVEKAAEDRIKGQK